MSDCKLTQGLIKNIDKLNECISGFKVHLAHQYSIDEDDNSVLFDLSLVVNFKIDGVEYSIIEDGLVNIHRNADHFELIDIFSLSEDAEFSININDENGETHYKAYSFEDDENYELAKKTWSENIALHKVKDFESLALNSISEDEKQRIRNLF